MTHKSNLFWSLIHKSRMPSEWVYVFAVVITLAALLVRTQLGVMFGERPLLILFMLPIILSAYAGGLSSGLVSTLVAAVSVDYLLIPPIHSLNIAAAHDFIQWLILIISGVLISVLSESLRRSQRRFKTADTSLGQTEKELRLAQQHFKDLITSVMDAVISINEDRKIVLFNSAAEKMFGYTADEMMGQPLDILMPEYYRAEHYRQIDKFERTGITNRHMNGYQEITGVRRSGDEFPIDTSISQMDIGGGKLFTAILRDVTERRQVEETLRKMHDELELEFQQRTTALSQTNALLETMLEYVPDQIYFKDAESRFIKNSRSQATALGLTDPSEVVGKTDFDFFSHAQRSYDEEQKIIRTGEPLVDFEEQVIWPGGKANWVSTTKVPLRNQEGRIIGTFGISRDITERKRAEESLRKAKDELEVRVAERTAELREANKQLQLELNERLRVEEALRDNEKQLKQIQNIAGLGNYFIDITTGVWKGSEIFYNLLGIDETFERTMETWPSLIHPDDRQMMIDYFTNEVVGNHTRFDKEYRIIRKNDQAERWVRTLGELKVDAQDQPVKMVGTVQDITESKQVGEKIRQLNETLEERITERTAQLESANKELEAFSYSVSHDLRSPLRGIDGWSLALLEDYGSVLDDKGQAHLQRVRAETQRMGMLIDDILRFSRITRADMNQEKVDLSAIAETVAARLQETKPEDRQVEFGIQKGLTAMGDPKLLDVVLTNLMGNAFKFTSKKQEAHIEFGQTVIEGERAFYVRDNGAGFDMNYAHKLFGVFQRMHRVSEFPGTGVGLAIVQRVIHRHGGSVWASSEVEKGTTIYFTLEDNK